MFHIALHPHIEYISEYIRKYGYWEKIESEILYEIFKANKNILFIDIGANLGYFSLLAASSGINTISFEPVRSNYELFEKSIKDNKFEDIIKLYKCGLGDKEEIKEFEIININMGCSAKKLLVEGDYKENVSIKLADYFLYEIDQEMVIKIDVENMELDVINGLLKTLSKGKIKYLLIEISKDNDTSEIFDILQKYNFNKALMLEELHNDNNPPKLNTNHLSKIELFKPLGVFKKEYQHSEIGYQRNFLFILNL